MWTNLKDRKPTRKDADCYGHVIVYDSIHKQSVLIFPECIVERAGLTHWMPTGLESPEPPDTELEAVQNFLVCLCNDTKVRYAKDHHAYEHVISLDELTAAGNRTLKEYKANRGIK